MCVGHSSTPLHEYLLVHLHIQQLVRVEQFLTQAAVQALLLRRSASCWMDLHVISLTVGHVVNFAFQSDCAIKGLYFNYIFIYL